jgi:hypothetical protein
MIDMTLLTYSPSGGPIKVLATGSPGTLIHSGRSTSNKVWIFGSNTGSGSYNLVLEIGGTTPNDRIVITIPPTSPPLPILRGNYINSGVVIRGYTIKTGANQPNPSGMISILGNCQCS